VISKHGSPSRGVDYYQNQLEEFSASRLSHSLYYGTSTLLIVELQPANCDDVRLEIQLSHRTEIRLCLVPLLFCFVKATPTGNYLI